MQHAVFPRGARVRPRLCLAVAAACAEDDPAITDAAAAALELLHCASLVHDDMPCFDNAATRRGRPSVHAAFGEPLALLTGDALIVLAFQALALGAARSSARLAPLMAIVAASVAAPCGIVAGQGVGMRACGGPAAIPAQQNRRAVRRRHPWAGACAAGQGRRGMAPDGRNAGRGLPDRR